MVDPISPERLTPLRPSPTPGVVSFDRETAPADFATQLRAQLEQVNRMQAEADEGIQNLIAGRNDNITEVLTSARKAEVAFSLLMEIRNKLVDAYTELKQLRV
ncbi:MAG TPA: flagellar hook-basal body complex protein FliE [Phycisphaerae bacterium]|jgi:flagellar hook-basal body complex protein FliE|nr:flagellar hook-basal body complex protein FliE [Phycisphaerae bacterium]HPM22299.1 flagellar hook-basal body complex protein FliE [Phycisphaerae bacterium]HQL54484.1 flagellar hook-basal body complex protein FliE [Phycisphaerae bacterium]